MNIIKDSRNARSHNDRNKSTIKSSLEQCGAGRSIVIDAENCIIGGNGVFAEAEKLGLKVRVIESDGTELIAVKRTDLKTDDEKRKLLALADNRTAELAEWDFGMLDQLMAELPREKLDDLCFDESSLYELEFGEPKEEQAPEAVEDDYEIPEQIKTDIVLGDLFEIGEHRLLCGDSTDAEQVKKLMNGEKADMVFTDPPYGVSYEDTNAAKSSRSRSRSEIAGDKMGVKEISEKLWRPAFKNLYDSAKDDCSYYMTMCQGGDQMMMMMMMMMSENWQVKHELIWVKSSPVFSMGRLDYDYKHEPIIYGWKKKHNYYGKGKFLKSVWEIQKPSKSELHPTMKPIELVENMLLNSSLKDNIILDLFLGSGTTMVASHQLNRKCCGMEFDPKYCQVIIDRMKKLDPSLKIIKNGNLID